MRRHLILFLAPLILGTLSGCQTPVARVAPPNSVDADIAGLTNAAVEHLIGNLRAPLDTTKPVLVTTIANVDDLKMSSTLGRLLTEQVAASLSQDGYDIPEVRLSNTLLVDKEGEFILSRELRKLRRGEQAPNKQLAAQAVVTGTYAAGAREVNVILKVVRLSDGRVIGTVSYVFPNGPNTQSLVAVARQ